MTAIGRAAVHAQRISVPPRRLPYVGQVLELGPGQWRWQDRPLRLRVTRVRADISLWYDGSWVWVEGDELDEHGRVIPTEVAQHLPALVHVDAIPH